MPALLRAVLRADVTFCWFGAAHAAAATLLSHLARRRAIVIIGGYEVASIPEIGYGMFAGTRLDRFVARYVVRSADILIAVSRFTAEEVASRGRPRKLIMVHNAIDVETWIPGPAKEPIVLTAGQVSDLGVALKGLDTFASATRDLVSLRPIVIGKCEPVAAGSLKKLNSQLELPGALPNDEVRQLMARSSVFCQLSMRESFGMAVLEAMASGCAVVVTDRGALPEVIGDSGLVVPYADEVKTRAAIEEAWARRTELGNRARHRAQQLFSSKDRERRLLDLVRQVALTGAE